MSELLDIVTKDDEVIATMAREEVYATGRQYVRVVEAFIRNQAGDLWIPVRTSDKKIAPNGFDIGVAGYVEHGETYEEAFRKEVGEELGWNIDQFAWRALGKFGPRDGLGTVSMVYEISSNEAPVLHTGDFQSARWMQPADVAAEIRAGHPAKSNLLPLLQRIYEVQ